MKFSSNMTLLVLTSLGVVFPSMPVQADVETTTVRTTTFNTTETSDILDKRVTAKETRAIVFDGKNIVLPSTATYSVVDPLNGTVIGTYDPMHRDTDVKVFVLGSIVIDQVTGKILATLSPSGQTIDVRTAPALDSLVSAIDTRKNELEQRITSDFSEGKIDNKEAAALRAELYKIASRETACKQVNGVLPYSDALAISLALNNLSDRLVLLTHCPIISPLLGSRIVSSNGEMVIADSTAYRGFQLAQKVDDEYTTGRLSAKQVSSLKEQLNEIACLNSKYRENGQLDSSKAEKLSFKLDSIESKLNEDVAMTNDKRAHIGIKVQ